MPIVSPFLDADELRASTFVRHVEIHESLGSTNDRAIELAATLASSELPALVVARHQTAGRGQRANTWWSAEGALAFSLLIDPQCWGIVPRDWPQLSLAVADAVRGALAPEIPDAEFAVKPPNDVLANGRKVSGILIESPGGLSPAKDRLIIGIGVNVNNSWLQAPPTAGQTGTALCDVSGRQHQADTILFAILRGIQRQLVNIVNSKATNSFVTES
jgi:BirA family biotin operon repressor/biotin-[acetyl-CoA-carboxylase] ligase